MDFMTDSDKLRKQSKEVYYRNGSSELEYQANEFAAAFLMPRKDYVLPIIVILNQMLFL